MFRNYTQQIYVFTKKNIFSYLDKVLWVFHSRYCFTLVRDMKSRQTNTYGCQKPWMVNTIIIDDNLISWATTDRLEN